MMHHKNPCERPPGSGDELAKRRAIGGRAGAHSRSFTRRVCHASGDPSTRVCGNSASVVLPGRVAHRSVSAGDAFATLIHLLIVRCRAGRGGGWREERPTINNARCGPPFRLDVALREGRRGAVGRGEGPRRAREGQKLEDEDSNEQRGHALRDKQPSPAADTPDALEPLHQRAGAQGPHRVADEPQPLQHRRRRRDLARPVALREVEDSSRQIPRLKGSQEHPGGAKLAEAAGSCSGDRGNPPRNEAAPQHAVGAQERQETCGGQLKSAVWQEEEA
eukprot:scaffold122057_cov30-Tisochrysis_lutea.AAC.1